MKKFLAVLLALCTLLSVLSACSGGAPASGPGASGSAGGDSSVHLRWVSWDYSTTEQLAFVDEVIARYQEIHPNVTIEYEYISNDQYQTWLQTQLLGGTAPELFLVRHAWGQQYLSDGTVVDLTSYLTETENEYNPGSMWIDTFQNGIISQVEDLTNHKYASIPLGSVICKFVYNKDMFAQAGIPEFPKTYEEFLDACRKLQDAGFQPIAQGMKVSEGGGYHWFERLVSDQLVADLVPPMDTNGTGLIEVNEMARAIDKGEIDLTQSPWKDAFPIIKDLTQYWYPGYTALTTADAWDLFTVGEAAMTFINISSLVKSFHEDPERTFEIGIAEFPAIGKETTEYATGQTFEIGGAPQACYCIPTTADEAQQAAAIDFLKFMSSKEMQQLMLDSLWNVISVKDVEPTNEVLKGITFKNEISPLKLFETYFDKEFWDNSVMQGQLYLLDQLSLEDYMAGLQQDLVKAKDAYVAKMGWSDENNWGDQ